MESFFETINGVPDLKPENFTLINLSNLHGSALEMIKAARLVMDPEFGDPMMADLIAESLNDDKIFEKVVKIFKRCNVRMAVAFVTIMRSCGLDYDDNFMVPPIRTCIKNLPLAKRIVRGRVKCTVF